MTIGKLCSAIAVGAMVALSANVSIARDFRAADNQPAGYPTSEAMRFMGERIAAYTNNRYNIKVYPNSALGSGKDTMEQVKLGSLDMTRISTSEFHGFIPETLVPSFPFIFRTEDHLRAVIYGPVGDEILAAFEKYGYIGLCLYEGGTRSVYGKKPIRHVNDMKGLKIRVQPSDLWISLVSAMGAAPTPIPFAEVYTALKTNLVDAAENSYPSYEAMKHFEAAPYYSEIQHVSAPDVVVFSKVIWDRLSKEDQAAIRKAAKESIPYFSKLWAERDAFSRKTVIAAGSKIVEAKDIDHASFVQAVKPVWDKYANTPELKALVQKILDVK